MPRSAQGSMATIDQFINSVGAVKTAADQTTEKAADTPLSEPGSIGGETTHPVKKVDDRLQKATEGERSAENSKDVKEDQGAPSVENAAEASTKNAAAGIFGVVGRFAKKAEGAVSTPGSAADDHISTTTTVSATGEDPKHETGSAKSGKEDKKQGNRGGTSHPASTENDQLDGHKYAGDASLEKLAADMQALGNNLLTAVHNVYQGAGRPAPAAATAAAGATKQAAAPVIDPGLAYQIGNEMAGLVNGTCDKRAADALAHDAIRLTVKQAAEDADRFIEFARSWSKQAEGEEAEANPSAGGGGEEPSAPAPDAAGAGGGGGEEDAMLAALGGGADAGGMGGPPGGGGEMGGGGQDEAALLAQVLQSLGVTPEEFEQAMQEAMGGGGGMGGPPGGDPAAAAGGGGGMPAPGGGGMETAAAAGAGKVNPHNVKKAEVVSVLREIIGRSNAKAGK